MSSDPWPKDSNDIVETIEKIVEAVRATLALHSSVIATQHVEEDDPGSPSPPEFDSPDEKIGRWTFLAGEVIFDTFPRIALNGQRRVLLRLFAQKRSSVGWKTVAATLWGENHNQTFDDVPKPVGRLRQFLKDYLEPYLGSSFPKEPIPHLGTTTELFFSLHETLREREPQP